MDFITIFPYLKLTYIIIKLIITIVITILEAGIAKKCMERSKSLMNAVLFPFDLKLYDHACTLHFVGCYMWMLVISPWLFTSYFGITRWHSQIHSVVILWYMDKELKKNRGFEEKYKGDMIFDVFEREVFKPETFKAINDGANTYKEIEPTLTFLRFYFTIWVCIKFVWYVAYYCQKLFFSNIKD